MPKRTAIEGVLDGDSGEAADNGRWSIVFDLKPWRKTNDEWQKKGIRVEIPPTKSGRLRNPDWRGGEIVRVSVGKIIKTGTNSYSYWFAIGAPPVRRLPESVRKEIASPPKPKKIVDRVLGTLKPEENFGWYSTWRTKRYEVTIEVDDFAKRAACEAAVAKGRVAIVAAEKRLSELGDAIAAKLVPIYNKGWRDGGPELTAAALKKSLAFASIGVEPSGAVNVILHCGKWFTDHAVQARISARGKISDIGLA